MWVESSAPSNIALIKYMGKNDSKLNRPANSSLSFSLDKLRSYVRLRLRVELDQNVWLPYERSDLIKIELSETGKAKYFDHFEFLKNEFKIKGFFEIQSANNFPADCGLASSASSFAALTLATHEWFIKNSSGPVAAYRLKELSRLSQKGSGSSCRSFFSPWALWHHDGAEAMQLPFQKLLHQVILCDKKTKSVSSSEAHLKVLGSDLFRGRPERAEERLRHLVQALRTQNWKTIFEISWSEFWDMHLLFHTSVPAFFYMNGLSLNILKDLAQFWLERGDGPIVTMDAGSNIHLLYRPEQTSDYEEIIKRFRPLTSFWTDEGYLEKS